MENRARAPAPPTVPTQSHCFTLGKTLVTFLNTSFKHLSVRSCHLGFSCAFFVRLTLQGNLARLERTGRKRKNQSGNAGMQSENSGVRKPEWRSCPAPPRCLVLSGLNEGENLSSQSLGELWVQARGAPFVRRGL